MIQQVVHEWTETVDASVPAGVSLTLAVAKELHSPADNPADRPPLPPAAVPQLMGLRTPAGRSRRPKVPLRRLTALAA
ncbi:hypothetical protein [Streptomyces sp. NPDC003393]|jgi:hypothetical protein